MASSSRADPPTTDHPADAPAEPPARSVPSPAPRVRLPRLVIVGRPNVGKSSLLNMLAGRRISIVDPTAGVTRDRVSTTVELPPPIFERAGRPGCCELVDTGGYGIEDSQALTADVERQIGFGVATADLILFVIDARAGVLPLDHTVADLLRNQRGKTPVLLVANKVDDERFEADANDAFALGFGNPVAVSATTRHGKWDLIARIREAIVLPEPPPDSESRASGQHADSHHAQAHADSDEETDEDDDLDHDPPFAPAYTDPGIRLAIVGKRNAGKSSLLNAILGEDRVIVSDKEGTTRDSIDVPFDAEVIDEAGHAHHRRFTLIDTAGVRKRKSVKGDVEYYATHRALRSVRRADVCVLVVDATVRISQVDTQLVGEIVRHHKPVVIVVNKWDLAQHAQGDDEEAFGQYLERELKAIRYAPIVFTTATQREGVEEMLTVALELYEQAHERLDTAKLNELFERITTQRQARSKSGKRARVLYVTQVDVAPPTLVLQVNDAELFDATYQSYLLNRLREEVPFPEVPIRLEIRGRAPRGKRAG